MIKFSTGHLFAYLSIFCYISFLPLFKSDVQPYFVLAAIVFFFKSKNIKLPNEFKYVLLTCFVAFVLLLLDLYIFDFYLATKSIQKFSKYLVFLISAISFYKYLKLYGFPLKPIKFFCYSSLIVGLIQLLFNRRFFDFFLYRISTDDSRGVTSIMSEPTHFGMYCLFLLLILKVYNYKKNDLYLILLFNIIFLSQSSQTIFILFIWGSLILFSKKLIFKIIISSLILILLFFYKPFFFFLDSIINLRISSLFAKLDLNDIFNILIIDQSVSERISHIILSFYWFIESLSFPNLYNNWTANVDNYNNELLKFSSIGNGIIISTLGSILFEIGFFSFPMIYLFYKKHLQLNMNSIIYVIIFSLIFVSAIQFTVPLYALLFSYLVLNKKKVLNNE